jgi:hypothetical protein
MAEILADAKKPEHRRTATARILLRPDLIQRHREMDDRLVDFNDDSIDQTGRVELAKEVERLEDEIEAARVPFTFQGIGNRAWSDLMRDHPPTAEQAKAAPRAEFNPDTFPAAAMAASCIDPAETTAEDFLELETLITVLDYQNLWGALLNANVGGGDRPKSKAVGMIRSMSAAFETTPASEGSLEASSSDE